MSYGVSQAYLPLGWYGTYVFNLLPQRVTFDQSDNLANHNQAGQQDQPENMGWTAQSIDMAGFIASTNTQAILDMYTFTGTANNSYTGRPVAVGLFTQDKANPRIWFSNAGFTTMRHFEYLGGLSMYKYPFHFQFQSVQYDTITCTDSGDHANFTFSFPTADQTTGYIVGIQVSGSAVQPSTSPQGVNISDTSTSTLLGTGAYLGLSASSGTNLTTPLVWPLKDTASKQSIQLSTAPNGTDTYTVSFTWPWIGSIPTISVLYLKQ